jgi:hypothetical protein
MSVLLTYYEMSMPELADQSSLPGAITTDFTVMAGLDPAIHVFCLGEAK